MPKLGHVWPRSSSILNYWFALLSVAAAFACVSLLEHVLKANPPISLFLCAIELVQLEIAKLTMPKRNVRNAEQSHIVQVANSISILGFCGAVLIDQDGGVLDGAIRVEAAKTLRNYAFQTELRFY
jgi:hypothetical protein